MMRPPASGLSQRLTISETASSVYVERHAVVLLDALLDAAELQPHDLRHHLARQRVVRDRHQPAEQGRREDLHQRLLQRGRQRIGIGQQLRVLAHVHDQLGADVRREQDDRVLEVDHPAFAVFHATLVEDLEEQLVHVGVGLLDLVEQHHAVGPAPHRLGQDAAFAVADVARRRALQGGDGVGLLELAHVDRDDVLLAAVERFGERERGLGLADARGAAQHEDADRLVRVVEAGARGLDAARRSCRGRAAGRSRAGRATRPGAGSVSSSFFTIRPTGMPVQSATTLATACASTLGMISGASPCSAASLSCSTCELGEQRARGRGSPAGDGAVDRLVVAAQASRAARGCGRRSPSRPSSAPRARRAARARLASLAATSVPRSPIATPTAASRSTMPDSISSASMRRWQSSTSAGVACWLTATRAHAVSSRLTALSGSWRAGM